jgi:hypothetical protein
VALLGLREVTTPSILSEAARAVESSHAFWSGLSGTGWTRGMDPILRADPRNVRVGLGSESPVSC